MDLAPIIIFVYNRPWHTNQTLESLIRNDLASESILYIYADGAKIDASENDLFNISEVRKILSLKNWCKVVHIIESKINKGLANSIIEGVTKIVNEHGKVIVLEDDIITSTGFLKYLNDALSFYANEEKVMHISGFMYPHGKALPETLFFNVPLCWGWATWKRAWEFFIEDTDTLIKYVDSAKKWEVLNKFGDDHLGSQLKENKSGRLKTWFIKWHVSVMMQNGYTLYPGSSLVNNIGFDNTGVHNVATDKFEQKTLKNEVNVSKILIEENAEAAQLVENFYSNFTDHTIDKIKKEHFLKPIFRRLPFKNLVSKIFNKLLVKSLPELDKVRNDSGLSWQRRQSDHSDLSLGKSTKVYPTYQIFNTIIGNYSYVAKNSNISFARIGKFCSIGPNFIGGWGIHPSNGISTSPMFYSTMKQNGITLSATDKIEERKPIYIGNDVFIGMNVTVLDGVTIGDGAIIGAGAIVSKDIPPYAIAVGNPIRIIRYRFTEKQIEKLLKIKWWDFPEVDLKFVEKDFFNVDAFIDKYTNA